MIQNSNIKAGSWYIHPGMIDTAIEVVSTDGKDAVVVWHNISGKKRRFMLNMEVISLKSFENSPYWQEQGDWILELPEIFGASS